MEFRLVLLVALSLFAVIGASTAVPLAEATCSPGGVYPTCAIKNTCEPVVLPQCNPPW